MRGLLVSAFVLVLAAPAAAQHLQVSQPLEARPLGAYAGVEPGEPDPPPALNRLARRGDRRRPVTILTWPGFSPLGDGGSRFFVQTTHPIAPEVRVEEGRVVLLFRNTRIHLRNSSRWLETRFFNTPVARARLERRGRDMAFVLYLRAPAVPRVSTEPSPAGAFHYVYVDFAPGEFAPAISVPAGGALAPDQAPPPAPVRPEDPSLRALENERPPRLRAE